MLIIDCDTHFGPLPSSPRDLSMETLVSRAGANGVSHVMAYSLRARAFDAREGNDLALAAAREHPEILPVATVDPRGYRYKDEIARVAQLGFVALRVFPESQGWSIDSLLFRHILEECAQCGLPVMVAADSAGKSSLLVKMAADVNVPIILLNTNYAVQAEAFEAAASRANTYLSTQFLVTPDVVEIAVASLGADRLVVGTNSPEFSSRQTLNMVMMSQISDADKALITGGNLCGLLSGQLSKLGKLLNDGDPGDYDRRAISGPIIDVHGHNGPWPFPMGGATVKDLEKLMCRRGIVRSVISSTKAITHDFVEGNAELARELEDSETVYGYVTVNPNYVEQSVREMRKYLDSPKFVGIKFHPGYAQAAIDCEGAREITRVAAAGRTPFLIHTWGNGMPGRIQNLAKEFPELPIIMGHGGVTAWAEAIDVLRNCPNVYTEFCTSQAIYGRVRATLDAVGHKQVLFGTDLGLFDPAYCLGVYEEADMTDEERQAVMFGNASGLFRF